MRLWLGLGFAGGLLAGVWPGWVGAEPQRMAPRIGLVGEFLTNWAQDRYEKAATALRDDVVEVLVDHTTKRLRKDESRFAIGLHPVRFNTIVPSGDPELRVRVRCVKVSQRQFGREIFGYRVFDFDVPNGEAPGGIVRIHIRRRAFDGSECP